MKLDISKIEDKPGVYILKSKQGETLYVGKANSLKKRLSAYLKKGFDPRINSLISQIHEVETFIVQSDLEALLLEANLIKKFKPEFNVQLKDDKDYLYIVITNEKFPKIIPCRKKLALGAKYYFGPFPSAAAVKKTLKLIRRIFPYSTCKENQGRACLYYHIGLCPGVCVGEINEIQYKKNISNIKLFLEGKKRKIIDNLKNKMKEEAKKLQFEEAAKTYEKIRSLEYILQPRNDVSMYFEDAEALKSYRLEEISELQKILKLAALPRRIEGYDISNIHGNFATGSMVVFTDGEYDKSEYRRFRIKKVKGSNDTAMMKETLTRRFKNDWPLPDLIIVDGGKGQLSTCVAVLRDFNLNISCAALAKKREEIFTPDGSVPIRLPLNSKALHLTQRLRDEAHRFAINYHRNLRKKGFLTPQKTSVSLN